MNGSNSIASPLIPKWNRFAQIRVILVQLCKQEKNQTIYMFSQSLLHRLTCFRQVSSILSAAPRNYPLIQFCHEIIPSVPLPGVLWGEGIDYIVVVATARVARAASEVRDSNPPCLIMFYSISIATPTHPRMQRICPVCRALHL